MSWWFGLDREIYTRLDDVARRLALRPAPAPRAPALAWLPGRPVAVLARQVATPSYEVRWFARLARRHGFEPVVVEHRTDRFTVHNSYKRSLATMTVVTGRSRDGRPILRRQRVVDLARAEGRRLDAVETLAGEGLVAYHHRKLVEVMGAQAPRVLDLADVVPGCGDGPGRYYREFFALLTGDVVLLEDFVACDRTAAFFQGTVLPAFRDAEGATGHRPQVARLVPGPRTSSPLWDAYPAAAADDPAWARPRQPARATLARL